MTYSLEAEPIVPQNKLFTVWPLTVKVCQPMI